MPPVLPSFLPPHTLPHCVSLLTRTTTDTLVIYLACWVQRTLTLESILHLHLPHSSPFSSSFPAFSLSLSLQILLQSSHSPFLSHKSFLLWCLFFCHISFFLLSLSFFIFFIALSSCAPGERERPRRPQQGHGGSVDRWFQDLRNQRHTYPDQRSVCASVCVCVCLIDKYMLMWVLDLPSQMCVWCLKC